MKYTPDGRIDLSGITVYDYEIAFARRNHFGQDPKRTDEAIQHAIALGKACGSYDALPAYRWWLEQNKRKAKSRPMLSLNDAELDKLYAAIQAEQTRRKARAMA